MTAPSATMWLGVVNAASGVTLPKGDSHSLPGPRSAPGALLVNTPDLAGPTPTTRLVLGEFRAVIGDLWRSGAEARCRFSWQSSSLSSSSSRL